MTHNFAYTALAALSITLTAGACATEGSSDRDSERGDASDSERAIRSSGAATDVIALSSELSQLAAAPSLGVTGGSLDDRISNALGDACATTEITAARVEVDLDCGEVTGRVAITFDDPSCLDALSLCAAVDVSVELELEVDGLRVDGRFDSRITETGTAASGELAIAGDGLGALAVTFDLSIESDGICDTIDGTMSVDDGISDLSVELAEVVDCGGACADSGVLTARAGSAEVTVDFDAGLASGTDGLGNDFEAALDCSF